MSVVGFKHLNVLTVVKCDKCKIERSIFRYLPNGWKKVGDRHYCKDCLEIRG